jgi:hypothetical protein
MAEKFSLGFDILSHDRIEASITGNPFVERNRLVMRLDMASRSDELKAKLKAAPDWGLVICDEAHRMAAPYFAGEVKEIVILKDLEEGALRLKLSGQDAKWRELESILDDPIMLDPVSGLRRKILIFTEPKDTLESRAALRLFRVSRHSARPASRRAAVSVFSHCSLELIKFL